MSNYSSSTVSKLKEILKSKGLSTAGVKSELIARLEAADAGSASATDKEEESVVSTEEPKKEEKIEPMAPTTAVAPATDTSSPATAKPVAAEKKEVQTAETAAIESNKKEDEKRKEKEQPEEMTADERKSKALELLQTKLKRAEKFGTDTEDLKRQIKRVERFGVELGTELAIAIGASKPVKQKVLDKKSKVHKNNRKLHNNNNRRHRR